MKTTLSLCLAIAGARFANGADLCLRFMKSFSRLFATMLIICFPLLCTAQILSITETAPGNLNTCAGYYPFVVKIKNTSPSIKATNILLNYDLVDGLSVSSTVINGRLVQLQQADQPVFQIDSLNPGACVNLTFYVAADCGLNAAGTTPVKNTLNVAYSEQQINRSFAVVTSSFNVFHANVSIRVESASFTSTNIFNNAPVLSVFGPAASTGLRKIFVSNAGGMTDSVLITIAAEQEIDYSNFYVYTNTATPLQWSYDVSRQVYEIWLTGADIGRCEFVKGNDPLRFENGEQLVIYEEFKVIACTGANDPNTSYLVQVPCNGKYCQISPNQQTSANITVGASSPQLSAEIRAKYPVASYCSNSDTLTFIYTNKASAPGDAATDVVLEVQSYEAFNTQSFHLDHFHINGFPVPAGLIQYVPLMPTLGSTSGAVPGYRIQLIYNVDPNLAEDLDGDGYYDDLRPGDALVLTANIVFDATPNFEQNCPINYYMLAGKPQVRFKAPCGDLEKQTGCEPHNYYHYMMRTNGKFNGVIEGTSDMVENKPEAFAFCTGTFQSAEEMLSCPVDSFYIRVHLPKGYDISGNSVTFRSYDYKKANLMAVHEDSSTLLIAYDGKAGWQGCYRMQLLMSCDFIQEDMPGTADLSWELDYICDTCSKIQRRVCDRKLIYNHAGCNQVVANCQGVVTQGFKAERRSFGWTDYSFSTRADAITPGINLNAAYPFDTIRTTTTGMLIGTTPTSISCEIYYNAPVEAFKWIGGRAEIYDDAGNFQYSVAITSAPSFVQSADIYTYRFQLPGASFYGLQTKYQVRFVLDWSVINDPALFKSTVYYFREFRSSLLFGDKYGGTSGCDAWGSSFALYQVNSYPFPVALRSEDCRPFEIDLYQYNLGGIGSDDFPNEVRPLIRLNDSITVHIPAGSTYIPGSAFTVKINSFDANSNTFDTDTITLNPVIQTNDYLVFVYHWQAIDKFNQDNNIGSKTPFLVTRFQPACDRNDTTLALIDYGYNTYAYTANPAFEQHKSWSDDHRFIFTSNSNIRLFNYLPNITVSTGKMIQDAFSDQVSWEVSLCNRTNQYLPKVTDAPFTWLNVAPAQGFKGQFEISGVWNNSLSVATQSYLKGSDSAWFVGLGALKANTCQDYRIMARILSCGTDVDTLILAAGWNCSAYPAPEFSADSSCQLNSYPLGIRYKFANMNMAVYAEDSLYQICDEIPFDVTLESIGTGMMHAITLSAVLPAGAALSRAEAVFPVSGSNVLSQLPDSTHQQQLFWNFGSLLPDQNGHHACLSGSDRSDSSDLRLRLSLTTDCSFSPADSILFFGSGITNCGDTLHFVQVKHFNVHGFTDLDNFALSAQLPDSISCNDTLQLVYHLSNLDAFPNLHNDTLLIRLPAGLSYLSSSPAAQQYSSNALRFVLGSGSMLANETRDFRLTVVANQLTGSGFLELNADLFYGQVSNCGGQNCSIAANLAQHSDSMAFACAPCTLDAAFDGDLFCAGSPVCVAAISDELGLIHSWNCGNLQRSGAASACFGALEAGWYELTHQVYNPVNGCTATFTKSITVVSAPDGTISASGCFDDHLTDLFVSGNYTSLAWYLLPDTSTVLSTDDTLPARLYGTYVARLYNNSCTGFSAPFTLENVSLPELTLINKTICQGDSVAYCVPDGFASVVWYRDDIQISAGNACMWIHDAGEYMVVLGSKLPYGDCIRRGVYSFKVAYDKVALHLPDLKVCDHAADTLMPVVNSSIGIANYQWSDGSALPYLIVNQPGTYSLTVKTIAGCTAVDTAIAVIGNPVSAEFDLPEMLCISDVLCVAATASGQSVWEVSRLGIQHGYSSSANYCVQLPSAGTFLVKHTISNGCMTDSYLDSIRIHEPVEACIVLLGQNPFCAGNAPILTINDPNNLVADVEWYCNDVLVFRGKTFHPEHGGVYRARVKDFQGCYAECMCLVLQEIEGTSLALPKRLNLCAGGEGQTLHAGSGHKQYVWFKDNQFFRYGDCSISVHEPGSYRVEVVTAGGCLLTDSCQVVSSTFTPVIEVDVRSFCSDQKLVFKSPLAPGATCQWTVSEYGQSELSLRDHAAEVSYQVLDTRHLAEPGKGLLRIDLQALDAYGCQSSVSKTIDLSAIQCEWLTLFPNPSNGNNVRLSSSIRYPEELTAVNCLAANGALVWQKQLKGLDPDMIIDLNQLSNGVYFIELLSGDQRIASERLVIQK